MVRSVKYNSPVVSSVTQMAEAEDALGDVSDEEEKGGHPDNSSGQSNSQTSDSEDEQGEAAAGSFDLAVMSAISNGFKP